MAASASGNIGVATLRLAAGANKDMADYRGEAALMLASESGHVEVEVVSMLVREGANREAATYFGRTALMVASSRGLFGIVSLLQEADTVDSTERQELLSAVPELGSKGNSRAPCEQKSP